MAAIVAGDILWKYSVSAAAGNTTASAASTSLGDQLSTSAWAGGSLNDLFDDISGAENAASTVDYRCVFIQNTNAANAYENPTVYLSAETAGGASISIAIDNIAASAIGSASAQAAVIGAETSAPSGVGAFSAPTTAGTGLALSTLAAAGSTATRAVWVKRTAANTAALSADGVTLAVTGDTGSL
jgi:hypothetical protein